MLHQPSRPARRPLSVALALALAVPAAAAAQQDTGTMHPDSAMMSHDTGMMKDHAMGHDSMAPDMMFMGAAGHKAAGDYEIAENKGKQQIKFTADFAVDQAPDTYVLLAHSDEPGPDALYLGKLKHPTGSQSYDIPKGTDLGTYHKLLVWSKKSKTLLASADLAASGHMMGK